MPSGALNHTGAGEQIEGASDLGSGPVAVEQVAQLGTGEAVRVFGQGPANVVGYWVTKAVAEDVEGGWGRIIPQRQGASQVRGGGGGFLSTRA
jgi:hypothetical protein